jgi:hypothetical protein
MSRAQPGSLSPRVLRNVMLRRGLPVHRADAIDGEVMID